MNLLIKPASGSCNMACRYCFYRDETENRETGFYGIMNTETMEHLIQRTFEFATGRVTFAFQGGEPTLAGLPFFEAFIERVEKWNSKRLKVSYAIQTNGYVLDRAWTDFFAKHRFLVGLSLDGVKEIHDQLRPDHTGGGTFSKVAHAAQLLRASGADFNILTVVTAQLARNIHKVYSFYARSGFSYQQYIPCLEAIGAERGGESYSLTPEAYGKFLMDLFDLWYLDLQKGRRVSIRYFDNLLLMLRDTPPESCGMMGICSVQNVVEADGSVYPCDFYVLDQYRLGNLNQDGFDAIYQARLDSGFLQASKSMHPDCLTCPWKSICRGGCRRDRDGFDGGPLGKNDFCKSYQMFFSHAIRRLQGLAYQGV